MARYKLPERPSGVKMCEHCGEELPATDQYFHRDCDQDDGFRRVCIACREKEREQQRDRAVGEYAKTIDAAALQALKMMGRGGSDVPHAAEVLQHIMTAFGGPAGFAIQFMNHFLSAAPGSTVRTKMFAEVLKIITNVSNSGAAQLPLELMDDEDVRRVLTEQHLRIAGPNDDRDLEETA